MKKLISSLLISTAVCLINTPAFAEPITHAVNYICPPVSALGNFGNQITGNGTEILSSRTKSIIYFQSLKPLVNVPNTLINYSNSNTNYDGPYGYVSCSYSSSNPSEDSFDIYYQVTNGKGGQILSRTSSTISILFYVGVR